MASYLAMTSSVGTTGGVSNSVKPLKDVLPGSETLPSVGGIPTQTDAKLPSLKDVATQTNAKLPVMKDIATQTNAKIPSMKDIATQTDTKIPSMNAKLPDMKDVATQTDAKLEGITTQTDAKLPDNLSNEVGQKNSDDLETDVLNLSTLATFGLGSDSLSNFETSKYAKYFYPHRDTSSI